VFLVNPAYPNIRDKMPDKFKNWTYLYPKDTSSKDKFYNQLASSRGMDINLLSIDDNTVISNNMAFGVNDVLDKNGFEVITTQLDNGELFAGGIHCSTLDLVREDECVNLV
jgi:glycine amidinotransferase